MSRHTPRHGLAPLDAENSDPQYSDSESKPRLNRLPPLSSPPVSKNAHYYSVLPKSGSSLLQLNSPRQTNARVAPSRDGRRQSWETKLKANQVLHGKSLSKRTERKLVPSTPKKIKDTVLTSSPLSSDEKTPEIKVGTTPPKFSISDCKRKLQLGTTEVISLLDELDTENLKDDSEDVIITAIEDTSTPTHGSYSEPAVDKTKKHSLQTSKDGTEAKQRSVTNIAQHSSSQIIRKSKKRRRVDSHNTNFTANVNITSAAKKLCLDSTDEAMLCPEDVLRPANHFSPPNNHDPLQTSRYQKPKLTPKLISCGWFCVNKVN